MEILGKTIFNHGSKSIVKLSKEDQPLVEDFCKECQILKFQNNSSLKKIKWQWGLENGAWFAGISDNKIFTFAGYHKLDSDSYRVLFRGAQLPGYSPKIISKNIFNLMIHWSYLLYEQVKEIQKIDSNAKIYISTNVDSNNDAPSSYKLSRSMAPLLEKQGLLSLEQKNIELFYTKQNLWRLNVDKYFNERKKCVE